MSSKKDKMLEAAQKFILKGQTDKAVKEYAQVVALDPGDMRNRQKLAELYVRVNRKDEAIEEYEAVGKYYENNSYYLKAIAVYKQIQKLDPDNLAISLQLAGLNRKQGLTGNALAEYGRVCSYYEKNRMHADVLRTLEQMVEIDPENSSLLLKLAETRFAHGLAIKAYEEFSLIAQLLLTRGDDQSFNGICRRVNGMFPKETGFVLEVLSALMKSGNPAPVVPVLQEITARESDNRKAWLLLAEALRATNAGGALQTALQTMVRIFPDDAAPKELLIEAALNAGDIEGALALLELHRPSLEAGGAFDVLERLFHRLLECLPVDLRVLQGLKNIYESWGKQDKLAEITQQLNMQTQPMPPEVSETDDPDMIGDLVITDLPEELAFSLPELQMQPPAAPIAGSEDDGGTSSLSTGDYLPEIPVAAETSQPEQDGSPGEPTEIDIELDFSLDEFDDMAELDGGVDNGRSVQENMPEEPEIEFGLDAAESPDAIKPDLPEFPEEVPAWEQANGEEFSFPDYDSSLDGDTGYLETIPADQFEFVDFEADLSLEPAPSEAAAVIDDDGDSAESLVSGVRKGLDEQLEKEDTETHYNLGIAFREMGLLDDAITEFRAAAADPGRRLDCFALQGVCYREKGDFRRAEDILKKGLVSAPATAAEQSPVKYELAQLYELAGRQDEAVRMYREIQEASPGFRDTAMKIGAAHGEDNDDLDLLELDAEVD